MSVGRTVRRSGEKVADMLRDLVPRLRHRMTPEEHALGVYLRGNEGLYEALTAMIRYRIEARARVPEPSEPLVCKSMLARDRELQIILATLEHIYRSPVMEPVQDESSEQPG